MTLALDGPRAAAGFPGGASVALVARPTNLPIAGLRWFWRCPQLGHVCDALFVPPGKVEFLSRQAHGLRYRTESERPAERMAGRARKLRRRLGEHPAVIGGPYPARPPWMRGATYTRLLAALREAEERALAVLAGLAAPRLAPRA